MYFSPYHKAFFDNPSVPGCRPVPVEVHNYLMNLVKTQRYIIAADENGDPIAVPPTAKPAMTQPEVLKLRIKQLNDEYTAAVSQLRGNYPEAETSTWPVQVAESKSYRKWEDKVASLGAEAAGPAPSTPFLTDLTNMRDMYGIGSGLADLVNRVLVNNSMYSPAMGFLTATRHSAERGLLIADATGGIAEINAVMWSFSFPQ